MEVTRISILGLGLIGGSFAKALKKSGRQFYISAFDRDEVLCTALAENVIDEKLGSVEESINSDLILFSLPTGKSLEVFELLLPKYRHEQIITDVCGIKNLFQAKWDSAKPKGIYIGGHPMTGKEKGGYENSDPTLFENCVYILNDNAKEYPQLGIFTEILELTGARVTFLNPKVHDIVIASVSHLPQIVSVSLINSAGLKDSDINFLDFAAGGFRDMTRIAASDFSIWEPVIKSNAKNILQAIDNFIFDLNQMKKLISSNNYKTLAHKFESARKKRDEIPRNTKGFIHSLVDLFVYVKDEPGVLAKLTGILFENGINIKDLELLKVREGTGGTFRISFEDAQTAEKAKTVILNSGFSIA